MKKRKKLTKEEKRSQISLTIFFSVVVFLTLLISLIITGIAAYIFSRFGILLLKLETVPGLIPTLIFIFAISLIIGFGVAMASLRFPLKPVINIITQMKRLSRGDFSVRLKIGKPFSTYPAFNKVEESFNKMAEDLQNTEMLRSDFINNFSHEFKTPIVSIAGFAKLLKRDNLTEAQRMEYIEIIETESLRLSEMANNVLNLTKVENQTILNDITSYNLSEQIRSALLLLESKWSKKGQQFSLDFNEVTIEAGEELLKQVWINLLDNAIKFSPEQELIQVELDEADGQITVSVTNQGEPISSENQKKIWGKFYQADESHSGEGNGIGLAIVKRVVDLHNGSVSVACQEKNITFRVTLPKKQSA